MRLVPRNGRYFNSQPHKEADGNFEIHAPITEHFNSQPHKEADAFSSNPQAPELVFQLTASQGG